jgi:GAF domain-containing protein
MYDPMIVDTFLQVHPTAQIEIPRQGPPSAVLNTIARSRETSSASGRDPGVEVATSSAEEFLTVYQLTRALEGHNSLGDAGEVIAQHLRRLIPSSLCVLYCYDRKADDLEARLVVGEGTSAVRGLRISLGHRLSGWVAANRQTISNSDARLDLAEAVDCQSRTLRSCISTPMVFKDELIGVLSLYSSEPGAFNDDHKRIIESVASQIAQTVQTLSELSSGSNRDALTGFASAQRLV